MSRRHPNVINLSEAESVGREEGTRFGFLCKRLGAATGSAGIGCNWYEIPPGRTAFPSHYHCANEEALYILEGEGTLRIGDTKVKVSAGDYATFPVGPDHSHQLLNTSDQPLRYLCMSTSHPVDVVGYPDSNKVAALAWSGDNPDIDAKPWIAKWFPGDANVQYYDGEDTE